VTSRVAAFGCALAAALIIIAPTAVLTQGPLRTPWGEPSLAGVWQPAGLGATPGRDGFNLSQLERLYNSDARLEIKKLTTKDDPGLKCIPQAFPRAMLMGQPIQIVQGPGIVAVMTEAFHSFRTIPTDNRRRDPDLLFPTYLGDSVGRWEGDTLVVDVTSFNGESWLANATDKPSATSSGIWPTSFTLHVIERWRRVDATTLEYEATVEDSTLLTGQWRTPKVQLRRQARDRIEVEKCFPDDPSTRPAKLRAAK
jgi:hypothetical protein